MTAAPAVKPPSPALWSAAGGSTWMVGVYLAIASVLTLISLILTKETKDIDVVYCENDGEALGAIDAMEEAGLSCNTEGGVIVISFDATKLGLSYCLQGKIALNVECNPLQGPYVAEIIQRLERGETVEPVKHVDEMAFDCFTITKAMIEGRGY